jgi:hypothetical protein
MCSLKVSNVGKVKRDSESDVHRFSGAYGKHGLERHAFIRKSVFLLKQRKKGCILAVKLKPKEYHLVLLSPTELMSILS